MSFRESPMRSTASRTVPWTTTSQGQPGKKRNQQAGAFRSPCLGDRRILDANISDWFHARAGKVSLMGKEGRQPGCVLKHVSKRGGVRQGEVRGLFCVADVPALRLLLG